MSIICCIIVIEREGLPPLLRGASLRRVVSWYITSAGGRSVAWVWLGNCSYE